MEQIAFLLVPGFSAMAFFSAVEPLRVANRLAPAPLFGWHLHSADGQPVEASNGMRFPVDGPIDERAPLLVLCAGFAPERAETPELLALLRRMARRGATLGAIDTGPWLLARAGLLAGRTVTLHWEAVPAFREAFPGTRVTDELYELGERLFTCAGGTAALDVMLDRIARAGGSALAAAVSDQLIHPRIRQPGDRQRLALSARLGTADARLIRIVERMEGNIEQPVPLSALAAAAGMTRRQMERLFRRLLGTGPAQHYRMLRLARARALLGGTSMTLMEVAMASGFTSETSLSRAYRQHHGRPPGQERARMSASFNGGAASVLDARAGTPRP